MCQFKSGIILKDRVFVPDYDSHSKMLDELKIKDDGKNINFIRAELVPANNDVFSDIDTWKFIVDQDMLPEWYVVDYDKQRMIDAVKAWAKNRIYDGVNGLQISSGSGYYLKNCKDVVLRDSSTVQEMRDSSTVKRMCDSSTVKRMYDSSTVQEMYDSSTVQEMCDSSTVQEMYDSSTAIIPVFYSGDVIAQKTKLYGNAIIKDNRTNTIYQANSWQLVTL